jgi:phosphoglucosamine mutase
MVLSSTERLSRSLSPDVDLNSLWNPLSLPKSALFGTDGIRGHVGQLLSAPLAFQIGFWAGQVLADRRAPC